MDALVSVAARELQTTSPPREQQARPRVNVARKHGPWSPDEDRLLTAWVKQKGAHDWGKVSQHVGTRSAKQCRERWHQNLKPDLDLSPITEEEGRVILDWVPRRGTQWAAIARHLGNRSDNAVKNWYYGQMNQLSRNQSATDLQNDAHQVSSPMWHPERSSDICFSRESLKLPPILSEEEKQWQNQCLPGIRSFYDFDRRDRQEPRGDV